MFANKPKFGTEQYPAGATIVREGDIPDKFYVIVSGTVDIIQKNEQGEQIINHMGARQFFGEIGLLRTDKRTASVRARTDVEVMSLSRTAFLNWLEQSDAIDQKIEQAIDQHISADKEHQTKPPPAIASPKTDSSGPDQFAPGTIIVQQGKQSDLFYIILEGEVEVFYAVTNKPDISIARLNRGDYFGEIGLLRNEPRTTSVRALTPVQAISFDRSEFITWMTVFPSGQHGIKQTAQQRLRSTIDLLNKKIN
jgi:cAMP-dependent protein kinase regulator